MIPEERLHAIHLPLPPACSRRRCAVGLYSQQLSDAPKDRYPKNTRYALLLSLGSFHSRRFPDSRPGYALTSSNWPIGTTMMQVREYTVPRVGYCGNGGRRRPVQGRWIALRACAYSCTDREWFTLGITVTPTAQPKPKTEPAKENARSKSELRKPTESGQSKPGETTKPAPSSKPAAPAEKAKLEPLALPLPTKTFYYTFVVFPAGAYSIGSVNDEADRQKNEVPHRITLTSPYAAPLDREITLEELIAFSPKYAEFMQRFDAKPADAGFGADWYDAVRLLPVAGPAVGLVRKEARRMRLRRPSTRRSIRAENQIPKAELGPAELAAGLGSKGISVADGIGVGSGQPRGGTDDLRLWRRREPAGAIWLVRREQRQARPSAAGIASEHSRLV